SDLLDTIDKNEIGACILIEFCTANGFVDALALDCIRPRYQQHGMPAARFDSATQTTNVFLCGNDAYARPLAASLRQLLVFKMDCSNASLNILFNRSPEIGGATVTGVSISNHRNINRPDHVTRMRCHFRLRQQADIRQTEPRG